MKEIYFPFAGFPDLDMTLVLEPPSAEYGGPVLNIPWYASRLGLTAMPICSSGRLENMEVRELAVEEGLVPDGIMPFQENTDLLVAFIEEVHHRSYYIKGKFTQPLTLGPLEALQPSGYIVLTGGRHREVRRLHSRICAERQEDYLVFNPSYAVDQYEADELTELIEGCDAVFFNELEALHACQVLDLEAVEDLASVGRGLIVCTLGDRGLLAYNEKRPIQVDSYSRSVVNPIGAGDALIAGFTSSLLHGGQVADALRFGAATAALVLEEPSVRTSVTVSLVEERLREFQ